MPLLCFNLHVDWHAEHRLAKVAFPLNIHNDFTTYEAPYGFVVRRNPASPDAMPDERAKYEVPGQKWMDHSNEDESYGLSLLNDCKYGFDTANDVIRMTLLRSAEYPIGLRAAFGLSVDDNLLNQLTDQGEHDIAYALYPHRSNSKEALTARRAYEFNYPLMPLFEQKHDGNLPKLYSFISAQPENLILTTIKTAEDSKDIILRFYETSGKDTTAIIRMAEDFKAARETDLLENDTSDLYVQQRSIEVKTSKHEIKTIKLIT
jgi:alpha-mannosidase